MTTEERLEKLERELARAKCRNRRLLVIIALAGGIGLLAVAFFSGTTATAQVGENGEREIRANRFVVVDEKGTPQTLETTEVRPDSQPASNTPYPALANHPLIQGPIARHGVRPELPPKKSKPVWLPVLCFSVLIVMLVYSGYMLTILLCEKYSLSKEIIMNKVKEAGRKVFTGTFGTIFFLSYFGSVPCAIIFGTKVDIFLSLIIPTYGFWVMIGSFFK